jgi:hypothetical protein
MVSFRYTKTRPDYHPKMIFSKYQYAAAQNSGILHGVYFDKKWCYKKVMQNINGPYTVYHISYGQQREIYKNV